jgi:glycosyltransferase involved in cell wall biosynthesis
MPEPRVSVLLPVYNAARFLPDCIQSLLNQTLIDMQIVAINDGSTDGSGDILNHYARADRRIEVHHRPNRGLVPTLNEGIELCQREFIARMDADDVAAPHRLEMQFNYLRSRPGTVALGSAIQYLGPGGLTAVRTHPPLKPSVIREKLPRSNCISHPTVMLRRSAVKAVGGYRALYIHAEDYDLWLRLRSLGELENLPEVLLYYRVHENQISARHLRTQAISVAAARLNIAPADLPIIPAEASILNIASGWAALLINIRQLDAASALIQDDALFTLTSCRRHSAARRDWLAARLYGARGRMGAALAALLRASVRDPTLLAMTGWKLAGRCRSSWSLSK